MTLPPEAFELVDRTVAAARLSASERARVRSELESHFLDGIAAGTPLSELVRRFGDPDVAAALIRRSRSRVSRVLAPTALFTAACAASYYIFAFVRLGTAHPGASQPAFEAEAAFVADRVAQAHMHLTTANGIWSAYGIAAELRRRRSMWAESPSILLLSDTFAAAESFLSASESSALRDSLRILAGHETLLPRREVIEPGIATLSYRLFGPNGRVDREGLRLLRQAKGAQSLSLAGRLLEPLYFAFSMSPTETRQLVRSYIASEWRRAALAGLQLADKL